MLVVTEYLVGYAYNEKPSATIGWVVVGILFNKKEFYMAEKGYYYLKLKENFFESDELKILESLENGYLYSNILLKLYLKALKNNGKLTFNDYIPYDTKMLATITGHNIDIVDKAIKIFQSMHLIEILDNGAIYMLDMQKMIGSISNEGIRKAEYRERIRLEKKDGTNVGQCPNIISNSISNSNYNNIEEEIVKPTKESKHRYGEYKHVLLSDKELEKLTEEYGGDTTQDAITYLDEYIEMKGAKYKSHYLAMRKWVFNALKENNKKNNTFEQNKKPKARQYTKEELDSLYVNLDDVEL